MSSPGDKLKLSDPKGSAPSGNAALGQRSLEDQFAEREQLIDNEKRIAQLERSNAGLEAQLARHEQAEINASAGGKGKVSHIAHAEGWQAICTAPDFCKVGNAVVAFNSFATLDQQQTASQNVKARGTPVYRKGDTIKKVQGDAGKHIVSGTSLGNGHVKILDGHDNVKVNGIPVARHDSRCLINCDASGAGGAQGKLVTERKSVGGGGSPPKDVAPPGERTSEKLAALKKARASVANGMLDLDAIDEYVNFDQSSQALSDLIAQISGTRGTALGYAAEVTRGVLGFGKDLVMGAGEMAYEGIKAVPKVVQLTQTQSGTVLAQLDAKILGENMKLGNITPGTIGRGTLEVGKAIVKPVTDPWAKGDYVEAVARGVAEIGTLGLSWLKGNSAGRATKVVNLGRPENAALKIRAGTAVPVSRGVHVRQQKKPEFSGNWDNYLTRGLKSDPIDTPEGRRMIQELEKTGLDADEAYRKTKQMMRTGSTIPIPNPIEIGDKFYKIIPEGGAVGPTSAFWMTEAELAALRGASYDQIADRLGVPLASQQGVRFEVVEITAIRPGTSFTSVIASTKEIGLNGAIWSQKGGDLQTLLLDRSMLTDPKLTGIKFP